MPYAANRRASTLAEVLVSIMILSVGILSLLALFPIAILRSLQATQLTNATILRYNVETAIDVNKALVYDPDHNSNFLEHDGTDFIVDPLGYARASATTRGTLGGMTRYPGLSQFDPTSAAGGQSAAEANALVAVTLPDSWVLLYEGVPASTATDRKSIVLDATDVSDKIIDTAQLSGMLTSNVKVRALLFSKDERSSQVRPVISVTGTTVNWTNPLPGDGNYTSAPRVRLEIREFRYTFLLTVRRATTANAGVANIDVVIFFRRPDPPAGETGYKASFVSGNQSATVVFSGEGPSLKQGGYVLDATNARWYRIQKITRTGSGATLQLDRPAVGPKRGTTAVVMEGVVDVFPIGNKARLP